MACSFNYKTLQGISDMRAYPKDNDNTNAGFTNSYSGLTLDSLIHRVGISIGFITSQSGLASDSLVQSLDWRQVH